MSGSEPALSVLQETSVPQCHLLVNFYVFSEKVVVSGWSICILKAHLFSV